MTIRKYYRLEAVHKRRPHKIAKNWLLLPPLIRKMSALSQSPTPLSVRTHHIFRKILSFLHQKVRTSATEETSLSAKCPHWTNSFPWLRTYFMDSPLLLYHDLFRLPCSGWWI